MKPDLDSRPTTRRIDSVRVKAPEITRSQELFGERRELVIEHEGFLYKLRITQNNKLILTK